MSKLKFARWIAAFIVIFGGLSRSAQAHSAEQGFILLLPTDIYITAGTIAVVASMVLMSQLGPSHAKRLLEPLRIWTPTVAASQILSLASSALLLFVFYVGITGPRDPLGNILPLFIWTAWWMGFTSILLVFGNIWRFLNPWSGLHALVFANHRPSLTLPRAIGVWPGVVVFLAFHSFALADIAPSDPTRLTRIVLGYWLFVFAGMALFGAKSWLTQVECFSILFRLIGSLAPIQKSAIGCPGWATMQMKDLDLGHAAFCVVFLSAGSFDGLHETFWWLAKIGINPLEFPGRSAVVASSSIGLLAMCAGLGSVFTISIWFGTQLPSGPPISLKIALPLFALSLIPIAYGYHVAHFLTSFLVGIQYAAIAASDPFANGANYLGFSNIRVTTGFLSDPATVKIIWLTQAGVVVGAHILGVIMAHFAACKLYAKPRDILLAQSFFSLLMIAYTVFGLWLLASPRGV